MKGFWALAAVLLLAGCGDDDSGAGGADKALTVVGISVGSLRSPFDAAIAHGAEAAARRINPSAQVVTVGDEYSAFKQSDEIDGFVASHADLIVLVPADAEQIGDAISRAHDAGATVVAVDGPATGADAVVQTDATQAGAIACKSLADAMGGHGQLAIVTGPGAAVAARTQGCTGTLAGYPDIHVAATGVDGQGTREGARRALRDYYNSGAQLDAVFAINDAEALGAADAAAELGRNLLVAGTEGSPAMEAALANRARPGVVASAAVDPFAMGAEAVRVGAALRGGQAPQPGERLLAPALVTRDTVKDYKGWLAPRE